MSEAVLATFADVRFIRTRSTMQLVLELPIEQADEALRLLGGVPQPGVERWVGVALAPKERKTAIPMKELKEYSLPNWEKEQKKKRLFTTLPLSQQAGILSDDKQFAGFLAHHWYGDDIHPMSNVDPVSLIYLSCGISSRAELDTNELAAAKWRKLESEFQAYKTDLMFAGSMK